MKKLLFILIIVVICTPVLLGDYTYTIDSFGPVPNLYGTESLLMIDEGGDNMLTLYDFSSATIEGTSALEQGVGGIMVILATTDSHLDFLGGELGTLSMGNDATATLSGGWIVSIDSTQSTLRWDYEVDPAELVPNPHIEMIVNEYSFSAYDIDTDILTGLWADDSAFSIYLENRSGYDPVIDNISFTIVPEPATLALIGLGGLLIRRRKK